MLNHPHIARQLAQQRQREMVAQASHWRLRRQSLRGLALPRGERLLTSRFGRPIAGLAAVLAMAVISACGGSSGVSGSGGDSSQTAVASSSSSASAAPSSTAGWVGGSARSLVGSAQAPAGCGPNHELDNCYSYDQMETLADVVIPMVEQYFNQEYGAPSATGSLLLRGQRCHRAGRLHRRLRRVGRVQQPVVRVLLCRQQRLPRPGSALGVLPGLRRGLGSSRNRTRGYPQLPVLRWNTEGRVHRGRR